MAIDIFNRQEIKYVINKSEFSSILAVIKEKMDLDEYNSDGKKYSLYNLYIDTKYNQLISHSLSRPIYKEKIRIRSYQPFNDDSEVFLEVKKRYKKITNKRRIKMIYRDVLEFIRTGILPKSVVDNQSQILNEFSYILSNEKYYPKTFISYDRLAYFSKDRHSDLRLTFDDNLRSRRVNQKESNLVLNEDRMIMEIKSSQNIPMWLVEMLNEFNLKKQGFSKYGKEYLKYVEINRLLGDS